MDKETAWSLFEATGNIDAYMLYHDLVGVDINRQTREDLINADQDRRPGYQGIKRR